MTILSITLPLLQELEVCIYNNTLADFAIRQFKNYVIKIDKKKSNGKSYKVSIVSCNRKFIYRALDILSQDRTLARKIIISGKKMYADNSTYSVSDDDFTICSEKKISRLKRYYWKMKSTEYSFYHTLYYELFLFPIFSIYCMLDGYYLVHGSLVL